MTFRKQNFLFRKNPQSNKTSLERHQYLSSESVIRYCSDDDDTYEVVRSGRLPDEEEYDDYNEEENDKVYRSGNSDEEAKEDETFIPTDVKKVERILGRRKEKREKNASWFLSDL